MLAVEEEVGGLLFIAFLSCLPQQVEKLFETNEVELACNFVPVPTVN